MSACSGQLRGRQVLAAVVEVESGHGVLGGWPGCRIHGLIADRAGVSCPTVYKYVGDQQAVVEALLHREVDRYFGAAESVITHGGPPRERFVEIVVFTVTYARTHALFQKLLRDQPHVLLPWLTTKAEPMIRRGIAAVSTLVTRGAGQGWTPEAKPRGRW